MLGFFPFVPRRHQFLKLVVALLFYFIAPPIVGFVAGGLVGSVLGITVILSWLAPIAGFAIGLAMNVYGIAGIVLSFMGFFGAKLRKK